MWEEGLPPAHVYVCKREMVIGKRSNNVMANLKKVYGWRKPQQNYYERQAKV